MPRFRRLLAAAGAALVAAPAYACTLCHTPTAREVRHWVLAHDFGANLMAIALPLPLLLGGHPPRGPRDVSSGRRMSTRRRIGPVRAAGVALGIGMGGFFDGILFHQILQVHNMLSARVLTDTLVGTKVNMVWDSIFHAAVWSITALGIALLWRACRTADALLSTRALVGAMLLGWGLFNVIEGLIDHHLLDLHHVVRVLGPSHWDLLFLAWGAAMILGGAWLLRSARARARPA